MSKRAALVLGGGVLVGVATIVVYAIRWRKEPSAYPYRRGRTGLEMPRPPWISRGRLRELLGPRPGERVLEVGPGTGYYALETARGIAPDGKLDILDVQQEMLDHTMRRASEYRIANITPTRGDAQALPYADETFDAGYLVATLGEVPDQETALHELRRVLKPGGRLVVGESLPDPHMVLFDSLLSRAEAAGFRFERRLGWKFGYFASFSA